MENIEEKGRKVLINLYKANVFCLVLLVLSAIVFAVPFFGIIFIATSSGDIWIAWWLTKEDPKCLVLDHPTEVGFYILDEE